MLLLPLNIKVLSSYSSLSELSLLCKSLHTQEDKANSQTLHVQCFVTEEVELLTLLEHSCCNAQLREDLPTRGFGLNTG